MNLDTNVTPDTEKDNSWQKIILRYARPDTGRSILQLANSVIPYLITWYLMYRSLSYSYLITLALVIPASGFLVRIFIIFHDCGHSSFFRSSRANKITGIITGILTFTPYYYWHNSHAIHHATAGNLDKRGKGDITTLTVDEYLNASKKERMSYRLYRHPAVLLLLGPIWQVFISNRFTNKEMNSAQKLNVYITNIGILTVSAGLSLLFGLREFLLIQLPIIFFAQMLGIWLFYVQHQYKDVMWERNETWAYRKAAMTGCSFLKLPRLLQWFTGNIGFHHIHHLSPRIPNYRLEECYNENEMFRKIKPVTIAEGIKALKYGLWDEKRRRLISFREIQYSR